jgi:hypothetical protein
MLKGALIQMHRQMIPFNRNLIETNRLTLSGSRPDAFLRFKLWFNSGNFSGLDGAIAAQ